MLELRCFSCNKTTNVSKNISRRDECDECGADLHSCRFCRFFDKKVYNECLEVSAETVRDKDASNFCDFFELGNGDKSEDKRASLLKEAEMLFKKQ